jgi:CRP-like cAMP-binding protein
MSTIEDDISFLGRVPVFNQLGAAALRILAIGTEEHDLPTGQVLFTRGEAADCAYVIQRGTLSLDPESGVEDSVVVAGPGTLLGESALLVETKRPATARAREEATVLRVSRSMFLRMLEGYPDAAERLRRLFAARANEWARDIENVRDALVADTGEESATPE